MKKPRNYHEPWDAKPRRSKPLPPLVVTDEMDGEAVARTQDAMYRAESNQEYVVWGTGNAQTGDSLSLLGEPAEFDDRAPVLYLRDEAVALRVAECVSAFAGVEHPSKFMSGVRELLRSLALGECDGSDVRVVSLLARCLPPEELRVFQNDDE